MFKPMKLVFILLGCVVIFLIIQYIFTINEEFTNNTKLEITHPSSSITFNKIDQSDMAYINSYIPLNSVECLNLKCNLPINKRETSYSKYYRENLTNFTENDKTKLKDIIQNINSSARFTDKNYSKFSEFLVNYTNGIKWNILKTQNLELDLPCTLSKCILMPSNVFETPNWNKIEETLAHEQVHILQRQNQSDFNEFYSQSNIFGNYITPIKKMDIDYSALELENVVITNPDEDNIEWVIKDISGYYIVPYVMPRNSLNSHVSTQTAYQIDRKNYIVTGNKKLVKELDYYKYIKNTLSNGIGVNIAHPNETFTDIFLL
jgi:hypothetical protein